MQVVEYEEGRCRCAVWKLPDQGWDDVVGYIDRFLAHSIRAIADEYVHDPVEWLEINHWPISGRLMTFPSHDGPFGNRAERVYFELSSDYLENEHRRVEGTLPDAEQNEVSEALNCKVWDQVGAALRAGEASRQLAEARTVHRFRLAAFDYEFGEGLFRLAELDEEAARVMQEKLAKFRS